MLGLPVLEPHFVVDTRHHGQGPIVFAWHPQGTCVATTGSSRVVHIFGSHGQVSPVPLLGLEVVGAGWGWVKQLKETGCRR